MTVRPPRLADARRTAAALALGLGCAGALAAQQPVPQPVQPPAGDAAPAITLADAIRRAEQVQPQVVQAQTAVQTAGARLRTTRAAYLPNLSFSTTGSNFASGGAARTNPITNEVIPGGSSSTSLSTSVNASLDLFTGFRRGADTRAAKANSAAAEASLVNARFQQALTTTNTYFDALAAQELVGVRQASVRRAEEQLKVSVAKLHAGSATRSDSLRSIVTLGNARLQLIQAQAQLATAEADLGRLVGAPGRVRAADDSSFHRQVLVDTAAVLGEAARNSPAVQSALASSAAADASLRASKAAYWPSLTLAGSTGWNGSNPGYSFYNNRQLSLQLRWTLFDRFQREQTIAVQAANAELATAQASDAQRQLQAGVTSALATLEAAGAQIGITLTSVAAATEDLRVVQDRYRLGASTIVDVLTSQEALNQAAVDVVNARFSYLRAKAQLEALLGHAL